MVEDKAHYQDDSTPIRRKCARSSTSCPQNIFTRGVKWSKRDSLWANDAYRSRQLHFVVWRVRPDTWPGSFSMESDFDDRTPGTLYDRILNAFEALHSPCSCSSWHVLKLYDNLRGLKGMWWIKAHLRDAAPQRRRLVWLTRERREESSSVTSRCWMFPRSSAIFLPVASCFYQRRPFPPSSFNGEMFPSF